MSVVIRLKVPIEMHYTVIPMGTSKVNSSRAIDRLLHDLPIAQRYRPIAQIHQWRATFIYSHHRPNNVFHVFGQIKKDCTITKQISMASGTAVLFSSYYTH